MLSALRAKDRDIAALKASHAIEMRNLEIRAIESAANEIAVLMEAHMREASAKDQEIAAIKLAAAEAQAAEATVRQDLERALEVQRVLAGRNIDLMVENEKLQDSMAAAEKRLTKSQVGVTTIEHLCFSFTPIAGYGVLV